MSRPDHLISRPAYLAACSRCGDLILIAMDLGLTIRASPRPLTAAAEINAVLAGRPVLDVVRGPGIHGTRLWLRDVTRMRKPRQWKVIAGHRCPDGKECLMPWQIPPERDWHYPRTEPAPGTDERIPF